MPFTEQLSQQLGFPCLPLPPVNRAGNTNTNVNGWVVGPLDMSIYRRAMGFMNVGAMLGAGAANTCCCQWLAGNTTNSLQAITSAAWAWQTVTNGANVSISTNNNFATIEIRADQLPNNQRYLALLINNQSACFFDAILVGGEACYEPAGIGNISVVGNSGVGQLNTVQGLVQSVT
jgi:hypothetical protein